MDNKLGTRSPTRRDFRADFNSCAQAFCPGHQLIDKVRIESLQRPLASMPDCDLSARPCSNVSELEGDVPASYKNDPLGQLLQLEELLTRRHVRFSWNAQLSRHRTGGDNHVTSGLWR